MTTGEPVDTRAAESGFRLLRRRRDLLSLTVLTWLFFFFYGPVEAALPDYVARDLQRTPRCSAPTGRPSVWARSLPPSSRAPSPLERPTDHAVDRGQLGACLLPFAFAPVASGAATVLLAVAASALWSREHAPPAHPVP